MKNLFEISGDEIKRILSLHEESTKQQYLNVINEESQNSFTLQIGSTGNMKLPKGVVFKPTKTQGVIYARHKSADIYYNCSKSFFVSSLTAGNQKIYDMALSKELKPFCQSILYPKKQVKMAGKATRTFDNGDMYSGDYKNGKKDGKGTYKWKDGTMYSGDYKNGKKDGEGTYLNKYKIKFFGQWKDGKFNCDGNFVDLEFLDKNKTNSCKTGTQQVQGGQQGQTIQQQPSQQPNQEVTNYNTQIQQSLGVQQPSGTITDTDLDNILTKLG